MALEGTDAAGMAFTGAAVVAAVAGAADRDAGGAASLQKHESRAAAVLPESRVRFLSLLDAALAPFRVTHVLLATGAARVA